MDSATARQTECQVAYAGRSLPAHLCFWIVAVLVLALDLWSKQWAFDNLATAEVRSIISGFIEFRRSLNAGAVFGSFAGHTGVFIVASLGALGFVFYLFIRSGHRQFALHAALGLILAGAIGNLHDRTFIIADVVHYQPANGPMEMIIGVELKDASSSDSDTLRIGDWPDGKHARTLRRSATALRRQGVVRDFIKFVPTFPDWVPKLGGWDMWPWVFNIADAALVCGVCTLLINSWFERKPHRQ